MQRVLVAEAEPNVANPLVNGFGTLADAVDRAPDAATALERAESPSEYALVVIDLMLPGLVGAEIWERLRAAQPQAGVLALSARAELVAPLLGMRHGVDDYLLMPLEVGQAREKAERLLARPHRARPGAAADGVWTAGAVAFDPGKRRLSMAGKLVDGVSAAEFELVHFLARAAGSAFSRDELLAAIWGVHHPVNLRHIGVNWVRLADKLRDPRTAAAHLVTVAGERYMFVDPHAHDTESRHGEHLRLDYHP